METNSLPSPSSSVPSTAQPKPAELISSQRPLVAYTAAARRVDSADRSDSRSHEGSALGGVGSLSETGHHPHHTKLWSQLAQSRLNDCDRRSQMGGSAVNISLSCVEDASTTGQPSPLPLDSSSQRRNGIVDVFPMSTLASHSAASSRLLNEIQSHSTNDIYASHGGGVTLEGARREMEVVIQDHEEKRSLLGESRHRGELTILEKYRYDLSRAQLKASSRTSALLAGFAMVALVELQYESSTPPYLLILLGVVTTLLVSVHLLALMMSTCILPYIEANGCTQDSPHIRLKFYIDLSWIFSTCIGLVLFLIEIGVIFFVKFKAVNYVFAAYITTAMLVPVLVIFTVFSCLIHKNRFIHSMDRVDTKVNDLQKFLSQNESTGAIPNTTAMQRHMVGTAS